MPPSPPSSGQLRWFGCILAAVFGVLGAVAHWQLGASLGRGLWVTGGLLFAVYYAVPPLRVALYRAWMALVTPLGLLVNRGVLGLIYFGVITPIAFVMRPFRSDKLARRFDPDARSYWTARERPAEPARYFRQS